GIAVADGVHRDHPEVAGQYRHHVPVLVGRARCLVEEEDTRPRAGGLVVDVPLGRVEERPRHATLAAWPVRHAGRRSYHATRLGPGPTISTIWVSAARPSGARGPPLTASDRPPSVPDAVVLTQAEALTAREPARWGRRVRRTLRSPVVIVGALCGV